MTKLYNQNHHTLPLSKWPHTSACLCQHQYLPLCSLQWASFGTHKKVILLRYQAESCVAPNSFFPSLHIQIPLYLAENLKYAFVLACLS